MRLSILLAAAVCVTAAVAVPAEATCVDVAQGNCTVGVERAACKHGSGTVLYVFEPGTGSMDGVERLCIRGDVA